MVMKMIGEGRLQYNGTQGADTNYYNIAKDLSALNARNEEITDRDGHLYGYWCKIQTLSTASDLLTLSSVPNTWKVRNAFRKFHFAREHMFREAGVTKKEMGKYGRTLRPYFSADHLDEGDQPLKLWNVATTTVESATGGEWTYSSLASAPGYLEGADDSGDLGTNVDKWKIHILGNNVAGTTGQGGTKLWDSVGMVMAYNQDRMEEIPDATADSALITPNNPLAALRAQNPTFGEVTDIAEDQELEAPPYDIADGGDSTDAVYDVMYVSGTTGATAQHRSWGTYFFPAGIIALTNTASNSNLLEVEVLGKQLCKDVA